MKIACSKFSRSLIFAAMVGLSIFITGAQFSHAEGKKNREKSKENLEKIQTDLIRAKQQENRLNQRRSRLKKESNELRQKLITGAARLQAREAQATDTEFRLAKLTKKEGKINQRLVREHKKLSVLLAGLQRIERSPPPALAVQPTNALDAVRSAMLLGTIIPEIKLEANALARELQNLKLLRKEIAEEQNDLYQTAAELEIERREIKRLLKIKRSASLRTDREIAVERKRVASLGRQAKSLKELLARLEKRQNSKKVDKNSNNRSGSTLKLARLTPAIRFSKNRRSLNFPVQGERIKNYGDTDGFGGIVRGLSIASRSQAQVVSPNDGTIVYAGEFRGYGELLIINAGEGYHVLLAGMERITTEVGQFVLAGEPIGSMGSTGTGTVTFGTQSGEDRPVLYIEFRRNGQSLDPTPWWAGNVTKARG